MSHHRLVLSTIGADRPGIVAELSELISRFDGNIEDTSMTRLAGQFATMLVVQLPVGQSLESFEAACKELQAQSDIRVLVQALPEGQIPQVEGHAYQVTVAGYDRTGITRDFSQILAKHQACITDLNANQIDGEDGRVYILVMEFLLPPGQAASALEAELQAKASESKLDCRFRSVEAVAL